MNNCGDFFFFFLSTNSTVKSSFFLNTKLHHHNHEKNNIPNEIYELPNSACARLPIDCGNWFEFLCEYQMYWQSDLLLAQGGGT